MHNDHKHPPSDFREHHERGDHDPSHAQHRRGHHDHGRHGEGRRGLHSGRKLSSADLQSLLLLLLSRQASHGYELMKVLEDCSEGFYSPSPGMVYPALTYLEEIGHASVEADGAKKRYTLTGEGQAFLARHKDAAESLLSELERIGTQMANARERFAGTDPPAGPQFEALDKARRDMHRAQQEREPLTADEAGRVANILEKAAADIRSGGQK